MKLEEGNPLIEEFLYEYFTKEQRVDSSEQLLYNSINHVSVDGLNLEFGVWRGGSINYLGALKPNLKFYGFDSFKGLPEDWSTFYPKGWMAVDGPPKTCVNVELVVGLFQDTLKPFLEKHPEKVAFLNLDADLYSSTKYVLFTLADHNRLQSGTVIKFDEVFYQDSPHTILDDEHRVFNEFIVTYDVEFNWLYFTTKRFTVRAVLEITRFGGRRT